VAEKNNWVMMLQVDAMLPCVDVQLVFQSTPDGLCTRGARQKVWTHGESGLSRAFDNDGLGKVNGTVLKLSGWM
jgi:hypothetical protein